MLLISVSHGPEVIVLLISVSHGPGVIVLLISVSRGPEGMVLLISVSPGDVVFYYWYKLEKNFYQNLTKLSDMT